MLFLWRFQTEREGLSQPSPGAGGAGALEGSASDAGSPSLPSPFAGRCLTLWKWGICSSSASQGFFLFWGFLPGDELWCRCCLNQGKQQKQGLRQNSEDTKRNTSQHQYLTHQGPSPPPGQLLNTPITAEKAKNISDGSEATSCAHHQCLPQSPAFCWFLGMFFAGKELFFWSGFAAGTSTGFCCSVSPGVVAGQWEGARWEQVLWGGNEVAEGLRLCYL